MMMPLEVPQVVVVVMVVVQGLGCLMQNRQVIIDVVKAEPCSVLLCFLPQGRYTGGP